MSKILISPVIVSGDPTALSFHKGENALNELKWAYCIVLKTAKNRSSVLRSLEEIALKIVTQLVVMPIKKHKDGKRWN